MGRRRTLPGISAEVPAATLDDARPLVEIATMQFVLKVVLATVLAAVVLVVGVGLLPPAHFRVERTLLIAARPAAIHAFVGDWRRWRDWADGPTMQAIEVRYSGPDTGAGARRAWTAGPGHTVAMEFVRSDPETGVQFESRVGGDEVTGQGSVEYRPSALGTEVIWKDQGDLPQPFGVFLRDGLEQELRASFDLGLQRLKQLAEARERSGNDG